MKPDPDHPVHTWRREIWKWPVGLAFLALTASLGWSARLLFIDGDTKADAEMGAIGAGLDSLKEVIKSNKLTARALLARYDSLHPPVAKVMPAPWVIPYTTFTTRVGLRQATLHAAGDSIALTVVDSLLREAIRDSSSLVATTDTSPTTRKVVASLDTLLTRERAQWRCLAAASDCFRHEHRALHTAMVGALVSAPYGDMSPAGRWARALGDGLSAGNQLDIEYDDYQRRFTELTERREAWLPMAKQRYYTAWVLFPVSILSLIGLSVWALRVPKPVKSLPPPKKKRRRR